MCANMYAERGGNTREGGGLTILDELLLTVSSHLSCPRYQSFRCRVVSIRFYGLSGQCIKRRHGRSCRRAEALLSYFSSTSSHAYRLGSWEIPSEVDEDSSWVWSEEVALASVWNWLVLWLSSCLSICRSASGAAMTDGGARRGREAPSVSRG